MSSAVAGKCSYRHCYFSKPDSKPEIFGCKIGPVFLGGTQTQITKIFRKNNMPNRSKHISHIYEGVWSFVRILSELEFRGVIFHDVKFRAPRISGSAHLQNNESKRPKFSRAAPQLKPHSEVRMSTR